MSKGLAIVIGVGLVGCAGVGVLALEKLRTTRQSLVGSTVLVPASDCQALTINRQPMPMPSVGNNVGVIVHLLVSSEDPATGRLEGTISSITLGDVVLNGAMQLTVVTSRNRVLPQPQV